MLFFFIQFVMAKIIWRPYAVMQDISIGIHIDKPENGNVSYRDSYSPMWKSSCIYVVNQCDCKIIWSTVLFWKNNSPFIFLIGYLIYWIVCSLSKSILACLFTISFAANLFFTSHTKGHISYYVTGEEKEDPTVFTGDTLVSKESHSHILLGDIFHSLCDS